MRIKTKLTLNVLLVLLVIAAVSVTSIGSMRSVKKNLVYLTERSTPFQSRTLESHKAVQAVTTDLTRLSGAIVQKIIDYVKREGHQYTKQQPRHLLSRGLSTIRRIAVVKLRRNGLASLTAA